MLKGEQAATARTTLQVQNAKAHVSRTRESDAPRMRILLINDYGSLNGGAEVIVFGLRDELRRRGHEVRVFSSSAREGSAPVLADDICHGTTGPARTLLQCMNFSAARELRKTLAMFRPDVVHVNLYLTQLSPLILPLLDDVPAVYYAQWYRAVCPLGTRLLPNSQTCAEKPGRACLRSGCLPLHDWLPLQAQRFLDAQWRGALNRMTAISHTVADKLRSFGGAAFDQVEVIHAGTPETDCRTKFSEKPVFVFAGRLVPEKGCDVLLRAFALVLQDNPDARLIVVGDGPENRRLHALADHLGISRSVEFKGAVSNPEAVLAMRDAWAVCVPSIWEEPFGLVAVEAQMNGVPVIASRCGGLAEIVTPDSGGALVAPGDHKSLAAAMLSFCAERTALLTRSAAAHRRATDAFRLSGFAERFEHIYSSLLHARRS